MKRFFPFILLVVFLSALPILQSRWRWEHSNNVVTLCVDGSELEALFPSSPRSSTEKELLSAGVKSVGVPWDGSETPDALKERWKGFSLAWRPLFKKISDGGRRLPWDEWRSVVDGYLLPLGPALPAPGPHSPLTSAMADSNLFLPVVEFSRDPAILALAAAFPDRIVRAHSIDEDELLRLPPPAASARLRRAVRERGVRFLYLHLFPGLSEGENVEYISGLMSRLRSDGFKTGLASPRWPSAPAGFPGPTGLRQLLAFFVAILGPWLAFRGAKNRPLLLGFLSLAVALVTAALLSSREFLLGLATFRGVKLALAVPFFLAAGELYRPEELKQFLRRPLTVGSAAFFAFAAAAAAIYLLRSGNESAVGASALEMRVRESLESFFVVRPRFKEFAVGWPLLWLGAHLIRREFNIGRACLLAGFVAPLSVVNTFCHAHIPLSISLLRVFHGFWLGGVIGGILVFAHRVLGKKDGYFGGGRV